MHACKHVYPLASTRVYWFTCLYLCVLALLQVCLFACLHLCGFASLRVNLFFVALIEEERRVPLVKREAVERVVKYGETEVFQSSACHQEAMSILALWRLDRSHGL